MLEQALELLGGLHVTATDVNDLEFGKLLEDSTWQDALDWAASLGDGWRLPTKEELEAICHSDRKDEYATNGYFWSSSSYVYDTNDAWYVHFYNGYVDYDYKTGTCNARCVRLGPKNSDKVFDATEESDTDASSDLCNCKEQTKKKFRQSMFDWVEKCMKCDKPTGNYQKDPPPVELQLRGCRCAKCGGIKKRGQLI